MNGLEANFKDLEEQLTRAEYAQRTRERIEEIVMACIDSPLQRVESELHQLFELNAVLKSQLEASNPSSCSNMLATWTLGQIPLPI